MTASKLRRQPQVVTAEQRMAADRVARARRADHRVDPTGEHHATCAEIARAAGVEPCDVIDSWDERATIRTYDGMTRAEAEAAAIKDVRQQYERRSTASRP